MKIKSAEVEYVGSGVFDGVIGVIENIGIEEGDLCMVLTKSDYEKLIEIMWRYEDLCK